MNGRTIASKFFDEEASASDADEISALFGNGGDDETAAWLDAGDEAAGAEASSGGGAMEAMALHSQWQKTSGGRLPFDADRWADLGGAGGESSDEDDEAYAPGGAAGAGLRDEREERRKRVRELVTFEELSYNDAEDEVVIHQKRRKRGAGARGKGRATVSREHAARKGRRKKGVPKFSARHFTYTSWNAWKPNLDMLMKTCVFAGFAPEKCPETGRMHWQAHASRRSHGTCSAFVKLLKRAHKATFEMDPDQEGTLAAWDPKFDIAAWDGEWDSTWTHLDIRKSNGKMRENARYCGYEDYAKTSKKTGKRKIKKANPKYEFGGEMPDEEVGNQGRRTDLVVMHARIKDERLDAEQVMEEFGLGAIHQYGRAVDFAVGCAQRKESRTKMTQLWILYGATGTGKSRLANGAPRGTAHWQQPRMRFWDNYKPWQHTTVVLNELRRGMMTYDRLLDICDKYDCYCDVKGKSPVKMLADRVIVTSPYGPEDMFNNLDETDDILQLMRRTGCRCGRDECGCDCVAPEYGHRCIKLHTDDTGYDNRHEVYRMIWGHWEDLSKEPKRYQLGQAEMIKRYNAKHVGAAVAAQASAAEPGTMIEYGSHATEPEVVVRLVPTMVGGETEEYSDNDGDMY
jgi:hypothetical protein